MCPSIFNRFGPSRWRFKKQGRIHGYPSRVQVGRGHLRSLDHLGRSSEAKDCKNQRKVKCYGPTDGRTNGPTKRGVESRSTRLKSRK